MNGSCNEYGFKNQGFLRRRLEKGRIQGLNASIAPVIGWSRLKLVGIWGLCKGGVNLVDGLWWMVDGPRWKIGQPVFLLTSAACFAASSINHQPTTINPLIIADAQRLTAVYFHLSFSFNIFPKKECWL
jgi:hypothetical protein